MTASRSGPGLKMTTRLSSIYISRGSWCILDGIAFNGTAINC